ncbi:hypothetical protein [Pseudarthrobacter sp. N5]|uniref:hypothetical protein n=1 Tax=Pseudarthrobacter sp. N5 TaxID=3418416 RepID=UPI003CF096A6
MAISVLLALTRCVTVPDLRHFLSHLPEGFNLGKDLRMHPEADGRTNFLEIQIPVPLEDE